MIHFNYRLILITGFIGLSVAHAHVCYDAFGLKVAQEKLPIESLNESWSIHSKETNARLKAGQAHIHLNRALYPMIGKLHGEVARLTSFEIKDRLQKLEDHSPVGMSVYEYTIPKLIVELRTSQSVQLVRDNARALNFYEPNQMGGTAQRFLQTKPNAEDVKSMGLMFEQFGLTMTPVSEAYGEKFSLALLRTNQILNALAVERLKAVSNEVFEKNDNLLRAETARAKGALNEGADPKMTPLAILSEGILSFHQLVSSFTIEKVPGAESGTQAVHDLVFKGAAQTGFTADVTRQLPIGLVGPTSLTGRFFKEGLIRNREGGLELSPRVKDLLAQYRLKNKSRRGVRACPMVSVYLNPGYVFEKTGATHPEVDAKTKPGVQMIAESYWRIFEVVHAELSKQN